MHKKEVIFHNNDIDLEFKKSGIITFLGNSNNFIVHNFKKNKYNIITYNDLSKLKSNTLVIDEVKKKTKTIKKADEYLNIFNLIEYKNNHIKTLGMSDKIKLLILINLINEDNLIIYDLLSLLDYNDYELVIKYLKDSDNIIINITNNINEAFVGDEIVIINDNKLICYGKTLGVLNEEKTLKKLGLGLPFIIELNKYLMDYELIDKYYLTNKKLVDALWK